MQMAKILLVDDEDVFRRSLAKRLGLRGYMTLEAASGADALKVVQDDDTIDVVILDSGLPSTDGSCVLRALKQIRRQLPVVILSGMACAQAAAGLASAGACAVLEKPCEFGRLVEAVETALQAKHSLSRI